jgi:hypothetical protein
MKRVSKFNEFGNNSINENKFYTDLDFESKEEYFDYFVATMDNGQSTQLRKMTKTLLDEGELESALSYIESNYESNCGEIKDKVISYLIELLEK